MIQLLNKLIARWKGYPYSIDDNIPGSYLLAMMMNRFFMMLRGFFYGVKNGGLFFVARSVKVKCRSKLKVGRCVSFEKGVFIDALSRDGVVLGNNVSIGKYTRIEATGNIQSLGKGFFVGDNVGLGCDCFYGCSGGIQIGSDTIIGNLVTLHSENHVISDKELPIRLQGVTHKGITIGANCWIGAKVTVLDGAVIEDGCVIAAGAVVRAGIYHANGIYGGVPAKFLSNRS